MIKQISLALIFLILGVVTCRETKDVSFAEEVLPILQNRCTDCHSSQAEEGNINLENYQAVIKTRYRNNSTAMISPGNPQGSRLFIVINTQNESMRMPPSRRGGDRLPDSEIELIKIWIKEGAQNN